MPDTLTFAVVGHCTPDAFALRTSLGSLFPGSDIVLINDDTALDGVLSTTNVCLVNREHRADQLHAVGRLKLPVQLAVDQADVCG